MTNVFVEDVRVLLDTINGYFKEGTTHEQKILWIEKQIEFKNKDNRNLRNRIEEERKELRNGRQYVKALRIILRGCKR